jgi:hypothetical protein
MIGYDPARLAGLRSSAGRTVDALGRIRSDDPAASSAMAMVAAVRRDLEVDVLAAIGRIAAADPMSSWVSAPLNCSQPQPALCENRPVRSWFGPGYEVFGGRVTNVEWLTIASSGEYTQRVHRGDSEWEGMDGIPIIEMFSGGTQITTWTVEDAYVEYSYASVDRRGELRDPVPRAAFEGDVEVIEYREYTRFQPQVGIPVGGPPGSRSGDPTAELDLVIPIDHTVLSANATYSVRLLGGDPVPVGRPPSTATRTFSRNIQLTALESADED